MDNNQINELRKMSRVDVAYMYEEVHDILNSKDWAEQSYKASRLLDMLAHNFNVDTGHKIGTVGDL